MKTQLFSARGARYIFKMSLLELSDSMHRPHAISVRRVIVGLLVGRERNNGLSSALLDDTGAAGWVRSCR